MLPSLAALSNVAAVSSKKVLLPAPPSLSKRKPCKLALEMAYKHAARQYFFVGSSVIGVEGELHVASLTHRHGAPGEGMPLCFSSVLSWILPF